MSRDSSLLITIMLKPQYQPPYPWCSIYSAIMELGPYQGFRDLTLYMEPLGMGKLRKTSSNNNRLRSWITRFMVSDLAIWGTYSQSHAQNPSSLPYDCSILCRWPSNVSSLDLGLLWTRRNTKWALNIGALDPYTYYELLDCVWALNPFTCLWLVGNGGMGYNYNY